jgi:IS30 family transposase
MTLFTNISFATLKGELRKIFTQHMRMRRKMRKNRSHIHAKKRGQILDAMPISERPPEVESRLVLGHWDGDLLVLFYRLIPNLWPTRHNRLSASLRAKPSCVSM